MTQPEQQTVRWGVLFAVVGGLAGFGGTLGAIAIKSGAIMEDVAQHDVTMKAHDLEIRETSDRISRIEGRVGVTEAVITEIHDSLKRIEERIDKDQGKGK